jgi:histidine triad (HIT) family protein
MSEPVVNPETCEFCKIARGDSKSVEVICESGNWIAFFPLNPATPGHTLLIPRKHVVNLWEAEPALAAELMKAVIRVGRAIATAISPEGMNLITSAGSVAEQSIFHLHLHVVPRWRRDGFGDIWPPKKRYQDDQLENVADRIRTACAAASS